MCVTECLKTQDQREEGIKKEIKKGKKALQCVTECHGVLQVYCTV